MDMHRQTNEMLFSTMTTTTMSLSKLPSIEDPLTKDIAKNEHQKEDMIKLIIEKNIQLKKMEEQLEELLKEKEETQLLWFQSQ